ncbi:MAG: two-component system C4-dicarboxylate transport sensor histidine kinase DctB [Myxococcota bacterium]|jgi:two-component system C4-dicarboxylate transport sensor histidine kinase DctB
MLAMNMATGLSAVLPLSPSTTRLSVSADSTWEDVAQLAELGVLTASLVHELRQPLFAIRAIAELLNASETGRVQERIAEIIVQARYAEGLVQHYGVLDNRDADDVLLDVHDPVRAAINMVGHRVRAAKAILTVDLDVRPLLVRTRPSAVQQVATNLLVNAIDAVASGAERQIHVQTHRTETHAELRVRDSGPGLADGMRERLFQPFVTSKPSGQGTGLGLAITRNLLRQAGGDIVVAPSEHTEFLATWPLVAL